MLKNLVESARILSRIVSKTHSADDDEIVNQWKEIPDNKKLIDLLNDKQRRESDLSKFAQFDVDKAWYKLEERRNETYSVPHHVKRIKWYIAAASIVAVLGFTLLTYFSIHNPLETVATIDHVSDKATLTLADGRVIELDHLNNGLKIHNDSIRLNTGEFIELSDKKSDVSKSLKLKIPKGGQFKVILSDGTKVWLNSESELHYPSTFAHISVKEVTLIGEAYFEVKKENRDNIPVPFVINVGNQRIKVLGTSFNVKAYLNDPIQYTTLVEGVVEVSTSKQSILLSPGEQSQVYKDNTIKKDKVDLDVFLAWKDGYFLFKNSRLDEIMKEVERAYDITAEFQKENLRNERFEGLVPRYIDVEDLLSILEATDKVQFEIRNKTILIKQKIKR